MTTGYCEFCEIIAGRLPSRVRYEDDEMLVFDNQLDWVPVMLLVVPRAHLSQAGLWSSGPLLSNMGEQAIRLGDKYCPDGFRILSNFGPDAMQSQSHGHLHVIGGTHLGLYLRRSGSGG